MATESGPEEKSEESSLTSTVESQHEVEAQERAPQHETMKTADGTEETIPMSLKEHASKPEIPEETTTTSAGSEEPEETSPPSEEEP